MNIIWTNITCFICEIVLTHLPLLLPPLKLNKHNKVSFLNLERNVNNLKQYCWWLIHFNSFIHFVFTKGKECTVFWAYDDGWWCDGGGFCDSIWRRSGGQRHYVSPFTFGTLLWKRAMVSLGQCLGQCLFLGSWTVCMCCYFCVDKTSSNVHPKNSKAWQTTIYGHWQEKSQPIHPNPKGLAYIKIG